MIQVINLYLNSLLLKYIRNFNKSYVFSKDNFGNNLNKILLYQYKLAIFL